MIRSIICVLLAMSMTFCIDFGQDKKKQKEKEQMLITLALLQQVEIARAFDPHECTDDPGFAVNAAYLTSAYFYKFEADLNNYDNIIIGDSTMDISDQYAGFVDTSKTQVVAVGGNKVCNMIIQMKSINSVSPQLVLISTNGGNDLLAHADISLTVLRMKNLIDKVRSRWPSAKIVVIAVHPSKVSHGNANKASLNSQVKTYVESLSNTCYFNPLSLFGVAEGEAAKDSDMADSIHYNQAMSFAIKTELAKTVVNGGCNITF